jgi:pyrroline-5-carboxylate reductase
MLSSQKKTITIIGAGNIGGALVTGLVEAGCDPTNLWITANTDTHLIPLQQKLNINISQDNILAASKADVLILAVKPQILHSVLQTLSSTVQASKPLLISIAAGFSENHLCQQLGERPIIRAMPNLPIRVRAGVTALHANNLATEQQKEIAEHIFNAVGTIVWLDKESDINIVSALSGSGPAYFFRLMQVLQNMGVAQGLSEDITRKLITQTALGSAHMALSTNESMPILCKQVASPGGGTEQAMKKLEEGDFATLITMAAEAALKRYQELAGEDD